MSLQAAAIDSVAPRIEAAAQGIVFHPSERWPEKMYDACRSGEAMCVADDDSVLVLRIIHSEGGMRILVVWWAHTERRGSDVPERLMPELFDCAKALDCQTLRFETTLEFWLTRGPQLGWTLRNMVFEMEVPL